MDEKTNVEQKENLEKKIGFLDRAKYFALPAALTIGSFFGPNIKQKYDTLPQEKKDNYRTVALTGTTILGTILAVTSGYNLFKSYDKKS